MYLKSISLFMWKDLMKIPFTETHEPNKLTYSQMCGFVAQSIEHCIGIAEVMGLNPVGAN